MNGLVVCFSAAVFRVAFLFVLVILAGCSGASVHSTTALPATPAGTAGVARLSLLIPNTVAPASKNRTVQFVSTSTRSAHLTLGAATADFDLGLASPICQSVTGGRTCLLTIAAPLNTHTGSLLLYDGPCTGGPPCAASGNILGGASTFSVTVAEGTSNVTTPLILGGTPVTVDLSANLTSHANSSVALFVTAYDAGGNIIIGPAPFVDATGTIVPITLAANTFGNQATLTNPNGAQHGVSVNLIAPNDTVTIALSGSADLLAVPMTASAAAATLPAKTSQFLPVSGTLTQTLINTATVTDFPDYSYVSQTAASQALGVPNGLAFSFGTQTSGEKVGWFDADHEQSTYCNWSSEWNIAVTATDGGLVVHYNNAFNVQSSPSGVQFIPTATVAHAPITTCGAGNRLATGDFAKVLGWDHTNSIVLEGDNDGNIRQELLTGTTLSATAVAGSANGANQIYAYSGIEYIIAQVANPTSIYHRTYPGTLSSQVAGANTLRSLTIGPDHRAYAVDSATGTVVVEAGANAPVRYGNGTFGALPTQGDLLAIGSDGNAYSSDGAGIVKSLSLAGVVSTVTLPAPSGNVGNVAAVFDGHNGYIYAYYADGPHAGAQYFFRISN